MNWRHANETQAELAAAESHFVSVCDTDGEVDDAAVEAAYAEMQQACAAADEALNAIRREVDDWSLAIAVVLR